ncbi:diphthine methyltransferase isoform X2 [Microcebus murinus]|uniref:diphthine methyltransferase isoform X2 n=1 Tax=Microcebus murinus TaxID=30608 RepID=UPI003F6B702F
MTGAGARMVQAVDTELTADSVEWCPLDGRRHLLACGTYQLRKPDGGLGAQSQSGLDPDEPQIRLGRLYLYSLNDNSTQPLVEVQRKDTSAILDMKWCHVPVAGQVLLGMANASGSIELFHLVGSEESRFKLQPLSSLALEENCLALSLDWSTGKTGRASSRPWKIISSDSRGQLHLLAVSEEEPRLQKVVSWQAHHFEAWIAAFNYWQTEIVYSDTPWACAASRAAPTRNTSWPLGEEGQEATVLVSQALPNSLVYGADWSWLPVHSPQPIRSWSCLQSDPGSRPADVKVAGGLPAHSFERIVNDDGEGPAKLQSGVEPLPENRSKTGIELAAKAAKPCDRDTHVEGVSSDVSLLATCSFYDHALHLWKWGMTWAEDHEDHSQKSPKSVAS